MGDKLYLDFETYSKVDLKKHGSMRYAKDPSTQPLCLGYAFNEDEPHIWNPMMEFPDDVVEHTAYNGLIYAHNALFDYRIWNYVLHQQFEVPLLTYDQVVDTMALCLSYGLPASLKDAGIALNIPLPKLDTGTRLINLLSKPNKLGKQNQYYNFKQDFEDLFKYCKRDVIAMRTIVNSLPRQELIPIEQEVWTLTAEMNDYGLPIDIEAVQAILAYITKYVKENMSQVFTITGGQVNTINQLAKLIDWCESQGVIMPNFQADTIKQALKHKELPPKVRKLLLLRQELGRTSTAKFKKLKELYYNGYVHDNLQYHGAGPGRWAGRGFQMQNLPRAKVDDPEKYIQLFITGQRVDDPVTVSKALIRSMILAKIRTTIICSDYSSIENRILAYLAGDTATLQGFANGFDQYKDMASYLYNVPYEDVTEDQRQMGKVIILGAGYMMGAPRFVEVALNPWGLVLELEEAKQAINAFREKYYLIVELWHGLKNAAMRTILTGKRTTYKYITFGVFKRNGIRWLAMQLPSGKSVYYKAPGVEQHYIPGYEHMGKVDTVTHEGMNPYTRKWGRLKLTPGRITENATQGTAREVMAYGMLNVRKNMPEVSLIGTVHDEALGIVKETDAIEDTMQRFNAELCDIPWLKECPLKAVGYFSNRYKKV